MKKYHYILLGMALLLPSCIPSLHPLYTPETLVFEPTLLGEWRDGSDIYTFKKAGEKGYILESKEGDDMRPLLVHLVKLGPDHYFDFFEAPSSDGILSDEGYGVAVKVPTHTFAKVIIRDGELEIRHFAETEWLEDLFEKRRIRIKHEILQDGTIVLTAGPEELQKFFLKYANDPNVFTESVVWQKAL